MGFDYENLSALHFSVCQRIRRLFLFMLNADDCHFRQEHRCCRTVYFDRIQRPRPRQVARDARQRRRRFGDRIGRRRSGGSLGDDDAADRQSFRPGRRGTVEEDRGDLRTRLGDWIL